MGTERERGVRARVGSGGVGKTGRERPKFSDFLCKEVGVLLVVDCNVRKRKKEKEREKGRKGENWKMILRINLTPLLCF